MAVREAPPWLEPMLPRPARVRRVRRETRDTVTLDLDPPGGALAFAPGQFTMLSVFGVGEVPVSISGDPGDPGRLAHTVRAVGAVTGAICRARPGAVLGVRGPYGAAWPRAADADVLVVAGGIGLAPLRPAILDLLARRAGVGRVALLCGARTPGDLLYRRDLERWRARFDLDAQVTVDSAGPEWRGRVGVVTALIPAAPVDPARTIALVCGPEVMMRFTLAALRDRGVSLERTYVSMERTMHCGVGLCGHCQFGPVLVCRDGPVFRADAVAPLLGVREV